LPTVLYDSETRHLTQGAKHKLNVLQKKVFRKPSGPSSDHMIRGWRKLHSNNQSVWSSYITSNTQVGKITYAYRMLMRISIGNWSYGCSRWADNIEMDFRKTDCEGMNLNEQGKDPWLEFLLEIFQSLCFTTTLNIC